MNFSRKEEMNFSRKEKGLGGGADRNRAGDQWRDHPQSRALNLALAVTLTAAGGAK
jgi:hypothetical protein